MDEPKFEFKSLPRIQNSLLSKAEKKLLVRIAKSLPESITPNHLTFIGVLGAVISGLGYFLTNYHPAFLWLASFGLLVNWFGDSLDGTVARVRNIQRHLFGFFIDHNTDALTQMIIAVCAGLSPYFSLHLILILIIGYYLLSIFTYINSILLGYFKISYGIFGPTELRVVVIVINTILFFYTDHIPVLNMFGYSVMLTDFFTLIITIIMFALYIYFFAVAKREYDRIDPPARKKSQQTAS